MDKINIRDLNFKEMESLIRSMNEKSFRAKQIFNWINQKHVSSFDEMTNLSKQLRENLKEISYFKNLKIADKQVSEIDGTIKYLFKVNDVYFESVFMKYDHGNTVCISSQAGCKMRCSFCASTINGFIRHLSAGEMAAQIIEIQKDVGQRISNVVVMGSGEPFDNYSNLINFIKIVNHKEGLEIGQRHITVSTCGLIDKIKDFTNLNLQVNLAISLHAPNDEIRNKLMPISLSNEFETLLEACKNYSDKTKRRITYEYALIKGVNDSIQNAHDLGRRLKGTLCHVNLIPVNEIKENRYKKSEQKEVQGFASILRSHNVNTTIRRELGTDIDGACGQLRNKHMAN